MGAMGGAALPLPLARLLLAILFALAGLWARLGDLWAGLQRARRAPPAPGVPSRVTFLPCPAPDGAGADGAGAGAPVLVASAGGLLGWLLWSPKYRAARVERGIRRWAERQQETTKTTGIFVVDHGPAAVVLSRTPHAPPPPGRTNGRGVREGREGKASVVGRAAVQHEAYGALLCARAGERDLTDLLLEVGSGLVTRVQEADGPRRDDISAYLRYRGAPGIPDSDVLHLVDCRLRQTAV